MKAKDSLKVTHDNEAGNSKLSFFCDANFPFLTSHTCHYLFTFVNRKGEEEAEKKGAIYFPFVC